MEEIQAKKESKGDNLVSYKEKAKTVSGTNVYFVYIKKGKNKVTNPWVLNS